MVGITAEQLPLLQTATDVIVALGILMALGIQTVVDAMEVLGIQVDADAREPDGHRKDVAVVIAVANNNLNK